MPPPSWTPTHPDATHQIKVTQLGRENGQMRQQLVIQDQQRAFLNQQVWSLGPHLTGWGLGAMRLWQFAGLVIAGPALSASPITQTRVLSQAPPLPAGRQAGITLHQMSSHPLPCPCQLAMMHDKLAEKASEAVVLYNHIYQVGGWGVGGGWGVQGGGVLVGCVRLC